MNDEQKKQGNDLLQLVIDNMDYLDEFSVENEDVFNEEISKINDLLFEIEKKLRI